MNRQTFLKLLSRHLFPLLRHEGFQGTGTTLRRIDLPLIHVVNLQASRSGQECHVNLGAHLAFLPAEGGLPVAHEALEEAHCAFRGRLVPPAGDAFGWPYDQSLEEAANSAAFIVSEWETQGRAFFARHRDFPASFMALIDAGDAAALNPRQSLHFARSAHHLGMNGQAALFARTGLAKASERATLLRADLEQVIHDAGVA